MVTTVETKAALEDAGLTTSDLGTLGSSNARLNIPINLDNWKNLDAELATELLWFHQHTLDTKMSLGEAGQAINFDKSTVWRVLKGQYTGSYENVVKAIISYKKIVADRAGIQRGRFAPNGISELIWASLDYSMANNSMSLIVGESGQGKTLACQEWRDRNNHGRTVMVEPPPIGGAKSLMRVLCEAVGVNKNLNQDQQLQGLCRAFNKNRMLIMDEGRRLLPGDTRGDVNPVKLEIIRYLHDQTGCAVAIIATQRFDDTLRKLQYQFEQVLGRVGQPVRLFRVIAEKDVLPIIQQYFPRPTKGLTDVCMAIVNEEAGGRLRTLGKLLEVASQLASSGKKTITEDHFMKALALRRRMMGEVQHARKA